MRTTPQTHGDLTRTPNTRFRCWRPDCRERFGDVRTLRLEDGVLVAECHKARYSLPLDLSVEVWRYWA